jgi:hypothetical protein
VDRRADPRLGSAPLNGELPDRGSSNEGIGERERQQGSPDLAAAARNSPVTHGLTLSQA